MIYNRILMYIPKSKLHMYYSLSFFNLNFKNSYKRPRAGVTCPYASLSFSAVSVQTAAVSLLPVVPGSQLYVQFSTAPAVISKPVATSCRSRYSVPVSALLSVPFRIAASFFYISCHSRTKFQSIVISQNKIVYLIIFRLRPKRNLAYR